MPATDDTVDKQDVLKLEKYLNKEFYFMDTKIT